MTTKPDEMMALAPRTLGEVRDLSRELAISRLLPSALQKQPADVFLILLTGQELGLGAMQSIRGIHVIDGKPAMSADLMGALCVRRRDICEYVSLVESTPQRAVYETKRVGAPKPTRLTWTIEQAQAAGLRGKGNWSRYPDAMLRARCLSALCRAVYPDLVAGVYDPDELSAPVGVPDMVDVQPPPPPAPKPAPADVVDAEVVASEPPATPPTPEPVGDESALLVLREHLAAARTKVEAHAITPRILKSSQWVKDQIRPEFAARLRELP